MAVHNNCRPTPSSADSSCASPTSSPPPPSSSSSHPAPNLRYHHHRPAQSVPPAHETYTLRSPETYISHETSSSIPRDQFQPGQPSIPSYRPFRRYSRDSDVGDDEDNDNDNDNDNDDDDDDDDDETLVASPLAPSSPHTKTTRTTFSSSYHFPYRDASSCAPSNPYSKGVGMSNYPPRSDSFHHPKHAVSAFPGSTSTSAHAPSFSEPRRPLIDLVTNEWQSRKQSFHRDSSFDSNDSYAHYPFEKDSSDGPHLPEWAKRIARVQVPRRVQRYVGGYLLFLLAVWFGWLYWLQPAWQHEKLLDDSAAAAVASTRKGQGFGVNVRPTFAGMLHLGHLDAELLPGASHPERRLVFVGDVHGCKDELQALLEKVTFNQQTDHLILAGDIIAKGPDSSGVLDVAMSLGASCVRGNWEDRTLLAHATLHAKHHPLPGPAEDPHTKEDYLDEESFSHGDYRDRALAKLLNKKQLEWLKACPVILRVGGIDGFNAGSEVVVAHAGLVPGVSFERQDPFQAMNMRSIDLKTRVPSEERKGEPWEKLWNHHQSHLKDVDKRVTVVYGHDAKRGLNIKKYSKGLDSGCVRGGSLTALVVDARGRQKVVSVECKNYRE